MIDGGACHDTHVPVPVFGGHPRCDFKRHTIASHLLMVAHSMLAGQKHLNAVSIRYHGDLQRLQ